ncbi:MAG: DUF5054 domain-containing protein [Christensenellaceae bacterium]|jgi:hypothetical protein|nr:DUF5054 domain-containing protein [Christensenellaceae bacterium]
MPKVIVVSKTHMDLGYTDYVSVIKDKYINSFIPRAIETARALNTKEEKKFVWTTGSWIIKEALSTSNSSLKALIFDALRNGDISPHALPFTTHSELLDYDTFDYGLSIVDEIDAITGRKTIAAKLTDVPGHTIGILPLLARHNIKLLHIGVNGASALPNVPSCFLWKHGDSEIVVIYSGDYGGVFKTDVVDDILYFDHTYDNQGLNTEKSILKNLDKLSKRFPRHSILAGRLDDYADIIWAERAKLPIITDEIGDTWIHGASSDPYKIGVMRELMRLKNEWLESGELEKSSISYKTLADNILCLAEHTCGMDIKSNLGDFSNYLRKDFDRAIKKDRVDHSFRELFLEFPIGFLEGWFRLFRVRKAHGSYSAVEKSWEEQRQYTLNALDALPIEKKNKALFLMDELNIKSLPKDIIEPFDIRNSSRLTFSSWTFEIEKKTSLNCDSDFTVSIFFNNKLLFKPLSPLLYRSYDIDDYKVWIKNYTRDIKKTYNWALGDFSRPNLKYLKGKFLTGDYYYKLEGVFKEQTLDSLMISIKLSIDEKLNNELGAPKEAQITYRFSVKKLIIEICWIDKPKNRLTEAILFRLHPAFIENPLYYKKLGLDIDANKIVENAGRNLSAVESALISTVAGSFSILNIHAPLLARGDGNFLHFEKSKLKDIYKDGISYVLHNNVWGTNFPLWYGDNARFLFEITPMT